MRHPGAADALYAVTPHAGVTITLQADLWRRSPQLERLRPALPGASIQHADFLADGRLVLILSLPPGDERQAWLVADGGQMEHVGPPTVQGSLAVAPDGQRVAYMARGDTSRATPVLDEVWIAPAHGERGDRRYRLPQADTSETLIDLAWSRDGQGLLLVGRQRLSGGGMRSLLR